MQSISATVFSRPVEKLKNLMVDCFVYAGWARSMDITAPPDAAPAFLTSAGVDDASHARQTVKLFNSLFKVRAPVALRV